MPLAGGWAPPGPMENLHHSPDPLTGLGEWTTRERGEGKGRGGGRWKTEYLMVDSCVSKWPMHVLYQINTTIQTTRYWHKKTATDTKHASFINICLQKTINTSQPFIVSCNKFDCYAQKTTGKTRQHIRLVHSAQKYDTIMHNIHSENDRQPA